MSFLIFQDKETQNNFILFELGKDSIFLTISHHFRLDFLPTYNTEIPSTGDLKKSHFTSKSSLKSIQFQI